MREPKNISNEISNPVKNSGKSTQTEEIINESKDDVNSIGDKNKDETISGNHTKENDLPEKGLTKPNNKSNTMIISEGQIKKENTPKKYKKIINIKSKNFEPVQLVKEKTI